MWWCCHPQRPGRFSLALVLGRNASKTRPEIVNAVLDISDGESETVTITEENFKEPGRICAGNLVSWAVPKSFARFVARLGGTRLI